MATAAVVVATKAAVASGNDDAVAVVGFVAATVIGKLAATAALLDVDEGGCGGNVVVVVGVEDGGPKKIFNCHLFFMSY